jgi:hypothetical protein
LHRRVHRVADRRDVDLPALHAAPRRSASSRCRCPTRCPCRPQAGAPCPREGRSGAPTRALPSSRTGTSGASPRGSSCGDHDRRKP